MVVPLEPLARASCLLTIAPRMTSRVRMQAVSASFFGFERAPPAFIA